MINCHSCGEPGHIAKDCQWESDLEGRPPWCGECDRETRLVDHGSYAQRCHRCWAWPAKGTRFHQLLPQHKKCGGCGELVNVWDKDKCGKHEPLGLDAGGHRVEPVLVGKLAGESP